MGIPIRWWFRNDFCETGGTKLLEAAQQEIDDEFVKNNWEVREKAEIEKLPGGSGKRRLGI